MNLTDLDEYRVFTCKDLYYNLQFSYEVINAHKIRDLLYTSNIIYTPKTETQPTKGVTNVPRISIVHGLLAAKEPAVEKLSRSRGNSFRVSANVPLINPACDRNRIPETPGSRGRETDEADDA